MGGGKGGMKLVRDDFKYAVENLYLDCDVNYTC
jgi:hypothetical protein